jgi:hypothetical protein
MHEILSGLPRASLVLDLGSGRGSFDAVWVAGKVVRVDLDRCQNPPESFVQADAAALPFPAGLFDAVISNHSLEHVDDLQGALREIRRVIKAGGALYVAVPDARTFADRLYRWLGAGGGHVNAFTDQAILCNSIASTTGLTHIATRLLHSGYSFLNRKVHVMPRRAYLCGGGYEWTLQLATYAFRICDRLFHTRLSIYGWACYFGSSPAIDPTPRPNVCVRCGSGHASQWLTSLDQVKHFLFIRYYHCPACGAGNILTEDRA